MTQLGGKMATRKKISRDKLDAARRAAEKKFGHRKYVTGVDVGYKWVGKDPTKELCIRVHVKEKIPVSALESSEVFPSEIDGVPLDVIEGDYQAKEVTQQTAPTDRLPVLMGGITVGHPDSTAGTLGCFVIDEVNETPAILSNWHVLVGATGRTGDGILQPGPADDGMPQLDVVANLSRSILDKDGDAAIAHLNGMRPWLPLMYGSFAHLNGVRDSVLGEVLAKSGRTTGQTHGRVDGEGTYFISYEVRPGQHERVGVQGFKLVSVIPGNPNDDELSSGGDSGSAWYNPSSGEAVGLHFAGETDPDPRAEHAIACNMTSVMRRLNIRLATFEEMLALGYPSLNVQQQYATNSELSFPPGGPRGPLPIPPRGPFPLPPQLPPKLPFPIPPWCPPAPDPWCPQCGLKKNSDPNELSHGKIFGANISSNSESVVQEIDSYDVIYFAMKRNHNIPPTHVQPFYRFREDYGLIDMELRNLAVPINQKLHPIGAHTTRDECQACKTVSDLSRLIRSKI